jgi:alkylation response protein AidB-like acyl-CoA dehydrogenase
MSAGTTMETVADFRRRAAEWIEASLPSTDEPVVDGIELQKVIFDGGFAGIAFPAEYGGAGLTLDHHQAFFDTVAELRRQAPTGTPVRVSVTMIGPTILDMGSHEAKLRFLPRLLRGDDVWIQVLSEPQGGSDLAGAITALTPDADGDGFRLNGSKMWSSGAMGADWGLCLCRSDWTVPKHQGLTMVAVPLQDTPGLTVRRTLAVDGQPGNFCEEFFDDVAVPASHVIGDVDAGWSVAHSLLRHERNSIGGIEYGYGFLGGPDGGARTARRFGAPTYDAIVDAARRLGSGPAVGDLLAEAYIDSVVVPLTGDRLMAGLRAGTHEGQWGSVGKLQSSKAYHEAARTALAVHGADGVIWDGDEDELEGIGTIWLGARRGTIAGGTSEIQRNIISERLLGLPREPSTDRDRPYGEVVRGTSA